MMTFHQKVFALIIALTLLAMILELVRKRKVKEEYSWLWILMGGGILVLVIWYDLLLFITRLIGAEDPLTTLFIFGFMFLIALNIHYSIKISLFTDQIKKAGQTIGLLSAKIKKPGKQRKGGEK